MYIRSNDMVIQNRLERSSHQQAHTDRESSLCQMAVGMKLVAVPIQY